MYLLKSLSLWTHRFPLSGFCWLTLVKTFPWISCKLAAGSRGMFRLRFSPFGQDYRWCCILPSGGRWCLFASLLMRFNSCSCTIPSSVHSLGVSKQPHSNSGISSSCINLSTSIKRCFHSSTTWLPSGAVHILKAGQMFDSFPLFTSF